MSVGIFQSTDPDSKVSTDLSLTNPIIFKFTQAGGNEERKLYLRHDSLGGEDAESSLDVTVDPVDLATVSGDQSTWLQVAPDAAGVAGTYGAAGAAVNLGNVNLGATVPFWIKATVPANTEVGARDDLSLKVTSINNQISKGIDLSAGTSSGIAEYDGSTNTIDFAWTALGMSGEYLSTWTDISVATSIQDVTYIRSGYAGGTVFTSYRTATDSSGTSPTAWFSNPADLDLTKDWIQIRLNYTSSGSSSNTTSISTLRIVYTGTAISYFDMRFYDGPATPILISPADGANTDDFNPPLTAKTTNGDYINFQLDNSTTFNSGNLTSWEALCTPDVPLTSQSPTFDRPSGVWYWRARSKLDGVYGNWTDYRTLTINAFVGRRQYLYLNVNSGFEMIDTITTKKFIYLNVNQGVAPDSIYRNRHIYLNVNVNLAVGEVIYPIFDRTAVRKQTFTEDSGVFV